MTTVAIVRRLVYAACVAASGLAVPGSVVATTVRAQDGGAAALDPVDVMQEFVGAFDGLEKALASKDAAALASHAQLLGRAARAEGVWRSPVAGVETADLKRLFRDVRRAAEAVPARADTTGWADAAGAVEDVRRACLRCHVRSRDDAREQGSSPARLNTITGRVQVVRPGGESRGYRSGVTVFLEGAPTESAPAPRRIQATVSQRGKRFTPSTLPVVRGQTVQFPNDDSVFHNLFSKSAPRTFDLGIYPQGQRRTVDFPQTGLVKVYCNIHPDMVLNVLVLGNGRFDITDEDGWFVLPNLPDGAYTLRAWDEGGSGQQAVTVAGGVVLHASVRVTETRRVVEHTNKFGEPYTRKY